MKYKISRITLVLYFIMLLLTGFLACEAGGYLLWFLIMSLLSLPSVIMGTKLQRIIGTIALIIVISAGIFDYHMGKKLEFEREQRYKQYIEAN